MDFYEERQILYSCPGIYSVACVITDNICYGESENVYEALFEIRGKPQTGNFENEVLQRDYFLYGESCFEFLPYDTSPELVDPELHKNLFERVINE